MNNFAKLKALHLLTIAGFGLGGSAQANLLLWDAPAQVVSNPTHPAIVGGFDSNTVAVTLGDVSTERLVQQHYLTGANSFATELVADTFTPGFVGYDYMISQSSGAQGTFEVSWGDSADMNLNLAAYGDSFEFEYFIGDGSSAGTTVGMTLWSGGTAFSSPLITLAGTADWDNPIPYSIPFSSFAGVDLNAVDRIQFNVNPTLAADLGLRGLQVVPEPSGLALVGLCGLATLSRRRRAGR